MFKFFDLKWAIKAFLVVFPNNDFLYLTQIKLYFSWLICFVIWQYPFLILTKQNFLNLCNLLLIKFLIIKTRWYIILQTYHLNQLQFNQFNFLIWLPVVHWIATFDYIVILVKTLILRSYWCFWWIELYNLRVVRIGGSLDRLEEFLRLDIIHISRVRNF